VGRVYLGWTYQMPINDPSQSIALLQYLACFTWALGRWPVVAGPQAAPITKLRMDTLVLCKQNLSLRRVPGIVHAPGTELFGAPSALVASFALNVVFAPRVRECVE